jgi:predicted ATP-dependent endonuclease of OLD family
MAVKRVEIKDFLVFKGEFAADFCPGVNVFIGGNSTGKSTLLKVIYRWIVNTRPLNVEKDIFLTPHEVSVFLDTKEIISIINAVYFPEKDILEHAKGLLPFIEQKQTGFDQIYRDALVRAQDIPTTNQTETQKKIGEMITDIIGGYIKWEQSEGSFYTVRADGTNIPFAVEASGFKKLGFLGLLVSSGQLEKDSILFWDEPENSLNPELVPELVDILLELSRNGVQIFIATHSEILAGYFAVNRQNSDDVMFTSLYKDGEQIKTDASDRFDLLEPNNLTAEPVKLYEKEIKRGLGK